MSTILELEASIHKLQEEMVQAQKRARSFWLHGRSFASKLEDYFNPLLQANQTRIHDQIDQEPFVVRAGWHDDWQAWQPQSIVQTGLIRYGLMEEKRTHEPVRMPAYAPFIGGNRTIIVRSPKGAARQGELLLQSLLIRTALMLPHQASYTLLDPGGNGMAFPMRRALAHVRANSDDPRRDLDQVIAEIRRIIETYLDSATTSFELVPEDIRNNERFHFVFAADFPNKYDRRAIEALGNIGNTGPKAGTYLFIHYNQDHDLPRDVTLEDFKNVFFISSEPSAFSVDQRLEFNILPDSPPPPDLQEQLFTRLSVTTPIERKLDWDEIVGIGEHDWWQASSSMMIETAIGKRGNKDLLKIWFGEDQEGRPCVHGILGAMPGAGKSSLYHALIAGLVTRYSPQELRLYLIDGKFGVEFQPYVRLPHAEVVSLKTSAELSRSVLAELIDEMRRRNTIFARNRVSGLSEYHGRGEPEGKLPRILLIVDEYQQLFEGDREGVASTLLRQLSEQGRSAGIHMLLASQRFGAAGMLNQTAIFGNIHLRMAMQMAETDIRALTEFGPRGKALILATCNLPGKIVINDKAGDDQANVAGKAVFLSKQRRDEILQTLNEKAQSLDPACLPHRVVFNGETQPDFIDNPYAITHLQHASWPTPEEFEHYARRPVQDGGLGITDWFMAEHPHVVWLGQQFNVRGQAALVIRRRTAENVVLIGSNNTARYGMLAATLISLSLTTDPTRLQCFIIDRSIQGAQWHGTLASVCDQVLRPAGFAVSYTKDERAVPEMLQTMLAELERRRALDEIERDQQPTVVAMLTELDRVEALKRRMDTYGLTDSADGEILRRLCTEGPSLGIHVVLSFAAVRPMLNVLDEKRGLVHFRHRIALQISEDESYVLMRSRKASQLQIEGDKPVCALYVDIENDRPIRFKPYSTEAAPDSPNGTFLEQLGRLNTALSTRSTYYEHGRSA